MEMKLSSEIAKIRLSVWNSREEISDKRKTIYIVGGLIICVINWLIWSELFIWVVMTWLSKTGIVQFYLAEDADISSC